jgi:diguanylate cyclase (GGDEF)-like protein
MPEIPPPGSPGEPFLAILIDPRPGRRDTFRTASRRYPSAALVSAGVVAVAVVATGSWIRALIAALHRERHEARHDRLTGLPNRVVVEHRLRSAPGPAAVGLLDLDRLKALNDHRGHAAGDRLLQVIALRLATAMADRGLAARLAGDEFVLLWDQLPADLPTEAAGLLHALEQPVDIAGHLHHPAASLGLAVRTSLLCGTDLLAAADAAMYVAKRDHAGVHLSALTQPPGRLTTTRTDTDTDTGGPGDAADRDSPPRAPTSAQPEPRYSGRTGRRASSHRAGRRRRDIPQ